MTVHTPIESRSGGVPLWALVLAALVVLVAGVYFVANLGGENPPLAIPGESAASQPDASGGGEPDPAVGEQLVAQATPQCASCHGADFAGQASFPSLRGVSEGPVSENLQALGDEHPDDWAVLWIAGNTPETEGIDRMGMPAYGDQFSPEQIASIVAYLESLE
jgi:mono/diheme cytochrome c family protein